MNEREFNTMNNNDYTNTDESVQPVLSNNEPTVEPSIAEPTPVQPQFTEAQQVKYNQYEDISSGSQVFSDSANTAPVPQFSDYEKYKAQFNAQQNYSAKSSSKKKKSGKGKKAAVIAATLALSLCLGVGGGVFGSYLTNNNVGVQTATSTVTNSDSKSTSATTSKGEDSGLNIIQSNNNNATTTTVEEVVSKVKNSVVEITTESRSYDSFYGQYVSQGAGSGVIISEDGYIVTNNHVIEDANTITVKTTDGKSYDAKLIGTDATLDVALIKIEASGLTVAAFGDSDQLNVGQTAIAIGNPLGELGGTVTSGIISALNREVEIDGTTMELLQTDTAINPGNSGGGLFDTNGNLIGIVVAKSSSTSSGTAVEGLGFVIPINNVKSILGDLKANGKVTGRASLDVTVVDVNSETKQAQYNVEEQGVYIYSLNNGGAAEKAGLKVGDRITKINDTEVSSVAGLKSALLKLKAGDEATVTVSRDGKEQAISVTLGETSSETETSNSNNFNTNGGNYGGFGNYNDFDF